MPFAEKGVTTYKLDTFTSTLRGAGTDATIYFQLLGDKVSGEARLAGACHLLGGCLHMAQAFMRASMYLPPSSQTALFPGKGKSQVQQIITCPGPCSPSPLSPLQGENKVQRIATPGS